LRGGSNDTFSNVFIFGT